MGSRALELLKRVFLVSALRCNYLYLFGTESTCSLIASLQSQGAQGAFGRLKKVASLQAQGDQWAFGPLKKSLRSKPKGPSGPLKKSLRSGPKGPLGPLGPLKKSLRSGIHARNHPKWSATPFISCLEKPKIGSFAAYFGRFWA